MTTTQIDRDTINATVLGKVTVNPHVIAWFHDAMRKWPTQWAGSKPTDAMLMASALFSKRGAGREAGFIAMLLRPDGCSRTQHGTAFNCGPAFNHLRSLVAARYFQRSKAGECFMLTFTAKGEAELLKRASQAAAEPAPADKAKKAKAKAKGKAKGKRKQTPATQAPASETPTSEAPTGNEGHQAPVTQPVDVTTQAQA